MRFLCHLSNYFIDFFFRNLQLLGIGNLAQQQQGPNLLLSLRPGILTNLVPVDLRLAGINSLRNKIDRGQPLPLIQTIRGVGYMLTDTPT